MGVSALLNTCVDCGNINALLIVTLSEEIFILKTVYLHCTIVIIDALVVLIMLRWNRPFPTWMYPCLFYLQVTPLSILCNNLKYPYHLQMAPYITEDFPVTFSKVHKYVRIN